jgi:hypothetical protein
MYVYTYIHNDLMSVIRIHTHARARTCESNPKFLLVILFLCVHACTCSFMYLFMYVTVYMCMYMYIYIYMYMYVYIYIYIRNCLITKRKEPAHGAHCVSSGLVHCMHECHKACTTLIARVTVMGRGTLDDTIWPSVVHKLRVTSSLLDGHNKVCLSLRSTSLQMISHARQTMRSASFYITCESKRERTKV